MCLYRARRCVESFAKICDAAFVTFAVSGRAESHGIDAQAEVLGLQSGDASRRAEIKRMGGSLYTSAYTSLVPSAPHEMIVKRWAGEDVPDQTQSLHQSSNLPFRFDNIANKDWPSGGPTGACSSTHKTNDRAT